MKDTSTTPKASQCTYALIVRSEERQRNRFETAIYTLLIIATLFAVSVFGRQALAMPVNVVHNPTTISTPAPHGV